MDPFLGSAIIGGGLNLLGNLFGGSQSRANAREQMRFQERMRDTAYQAAVKDLRKAGLNPMLAYQQGGADVPGGALAATPEYGDVGSSAVSARRTGAEVQLLKQQAFATNAQGLKSGAEAETVLQIQPFLVQSAKAAAKGAELGLEERKALSEMWKRVGEGGATMKFLLPFFRMLLGGR